MAHLNFRVSDLTVAKEQTTPARPYQVAIGIHDRYSAQTQTNTSSIIEYNTHSTTLTMDTYIKSHKTPKIGRWFEARPSPFYFSSTLTSHIFVWRHKTANRWRWGRGKPLVPRKGSHEPAHSRQLPPAARKCLASTNPLSACRHFNASGPLGACRHESSFG